MGSSRTIQSVRTVLAGVFLCAEMLVLPGITKAQGIQSRQAQPDSFFMISSVDTKKQQIVLKLPTEVTEVVEVTPATTYRDEKGKPLKFEDLRAGDTVYATLSQTGKGTMRVVGIRRGPMTLEELRRRYLPEE